MSNKAVDLKDFNPQPFELKLMNGTKVKLRPITLRDLTFFQETIKGGLFVEGTEVVDVDKICKVLYRFMDQESRKTFEATMVEEIDEDGRATTREILGWQRFRDSCELSEMQKLSDALSTIMGISMTQPDKLESEDKKKASETTKTR